MNSTIAAAVANQRHADLIAEAESRRIAMLAREGRARRAPSRYAHPLRFGRRPFSALHNWIAAGQM